MGAEETQINMRLEKNEKLSVNFKQCVRVCVCVLSSRVSAIRKTISKFSNHRLVDTLHFWPIIFMILEWSNFTPF